VLVDPGDVDLADVGVYGHVVLGQVAVRVVAKAGVEHALLEQRHRQSPGHAADQL
jgi:hypothetical protein